MTEESNKTTDSPSTRQQIRATCVELEKALADFESDSHASIRAEEERKKIAAIRKQLARIREQLESLS